MWARLKYAILFFVLLGISVGRVGYSDTHSPIKQKRSQAAALKTCVGSTEVMRRDHKDLLLHQRDQTVRLGIRTDKYRLVDCVSCHADRDENGQFIPVNKTGQFCRSCHQSVAVKLDCFGCHRAIPDISN